MTDEHRQDPEASDPWAGDAGWERLTALAEHEVRNTLSRLPPPLRERAAKIPVQFEPAPSDELVADGLDPDILGVFVGEDLMESYSAPPELPPQIILFLDNILDFAEDDADVFRQEVRTTYLHEIGHYLGLDEGDLEARALD